MKKPEILPERRIQVTGDISEESYREFSEILYGIEVQSNKPITIELMSVGGDAYVALAYAARIRRCASRVIVVGYGLMASAAVIILAYGHYRMMTEEAWVMVHEDQCKLKGDVKSIEKQGKHFRRLEDQWARLLAKKTKASTDTWTKLHKDETYLTAEECLHLGLVDEIV